MSSDPLGLLVSEMVSKLSLQDAGDTVITSDEFKNHKISKESFREISASNRVRRVAYSDGGNAELLGASNYSIQLNRLYFSMFEGKNRVGPANMPSKAEFFSYTISTVRKNHKNKDEIYYDNYLYPLKKEYGQTLPDPNHLSFSSTERSLTSGNQRADISMVNSLPRLFSEWSFAKHIVEKELCSGDVIVLDRTLQTAFSNETKYTNELYNLAKKKGVIVCGLSKTSKLFTTSGSSMLGALQEISEKVEHSRWYVTLSIPATGDDRGVIMVVKLHPNSPHIYRFEILREQYKKLSEEELNEILYSIACNSADLAMPGYPYGLIDADTYARVRESEVDFYRGLVLSYMSRYPQWKKILRHNLSQRVHEDLNEVVG